MALARALTKRAKRQHEASSPSEGSFRFPAGTIERSKISLPIELISTTNVNALSAPDIRSASSNSSNASFRSADDSDFSSICKSFLSTPATSADNSSIESSPITPEPRHGKGFFDAVSPKRSATTAARGRASNGTQSSTDAPALPQRALTHSKKAHQEVARNRSLSRLTPPPTIMDNATMVRNSADMFSPAAVDPNHPFGNELAQVNEVAEEFGGVSALLQEEEQEMKMKGLLRFGADDYVNEILGLWEGAHGDRLTGLASPWI
ncbi:hypothetical protein EPUS_03959 [Endocarpon pusillum Z07020]|uniref:Uncharacterized protein n=1 Tax=Endocarpon pusillum (strain Z07020 / HMAS-L-300199) TaxID=1263415 RepID=U1GRB0_ENDPU|nr:uncharacterized protein EPUS_03959 [Endocarpon pusillum Z07020]ERF74521.1 hypothetical protein EPUS_03959 [Endocarpon pusillum Z07020]